MIPNGLPFEAQLVGNATNTIALSNVICRHQFTRSINLLRVPGVLVHIRKCNFAVSSINVFYFCFTFFVQRTFGKRLTVRERNSVSLAWYRLTFFVLELDRDPVFLVLILFGVWIVPRRAVRSHVRWGH